MSIQILENEIRKFIGSCQPEVIAIHGEWGNGKTFFWKNTIKDLRLKIVVPWKKYSYVSLFGVNSLDQLKTTIFENTVQCNLIGDEPTILTLDENLSSTFPLANKWWHKYGLKASLGILKNFSQLITSQIHLSINNYIICLDDLERKGEGLSINEILGFISVLKYERNCKVVLIYNDEKLGNTQDQFKELKEKVIDKDIEFSLTSEECCKIALNEEDKFYNLIKDNILKLDIKNIRIIHIIKRLASSLDDFNLERYSEKTIYNLLHSLCLFCFCHYIHPSNNEIPSIEFLKNLGNKMYVREEGLQDPKEDIYLAFLRNYGYSDTNSFDQVIMTSIKRGFFSKELTEEASKFQELVSKEQALDNLHQAWAVYHESLNDNTQEVISSLQNAYYQNRESIPLNYVDQTVNLLRLLGENKFADEIINDHIELLTRNGIVITPDNYTFYDQLKDPELIKQLETLNTGVELNLSIDEVLDEISRTRSWSKSQLNFLENCNEQDFYEVFKRARGGKLSSYIDNCLIFERLSPPQESYLKIANTSKEALIKIAQENPLNKARLSKYGIHV